MPLCDVDATDVALRCCAVAAALPFPDERAWGSLVPFKVADTQSRVGDASRPVHYGTWCFS